MKLSAKTEYAAIALLELTLRNSRDEPAPIREIADAHGIPSRFLVQILLQLKNAGLVHSTRGAAGGYQLGRSPEEITLADVVQAVEGVDQGLASNASAASPLVAVLLDTWRNVQQAERTALAAITLADLAAQVGSQPDPMYYI